MKMFFLMRWILFDKKNKKTQFLFVYNPTQTLNLSKLI